MGQGLELLTGFATAPGATFTGLTMAVGNTLTIRSADIRSRVGLLALWAFNQLNGAFRVRSPRLHDNQQGIRAVVKATTPIPRYPRFGFYQGLIPQDVLTAEITGSVTAGQQEIGALLIYYSDLPGVNGRFATPEQVTAWGVNMMGQEVDVTTGAGGGYTGQVAVNLLAGTDQWKANTDYALMGYCVDTDCGSVMIQGVDTGNLGVGGPGASAFPDLTANWFVMLSELYNIPLIPVFNAANKNAILVDVAQNQAAAAVKITFFFVELRPPSLRGAA